MESSKVFSLFYHRDFATIFPDIKILGNIVDVFLECQTYTLKVPVNTANARTLNIFELSALKLIDLNIRPATHIASLMCLDLELVTDIISRLKQSQLIDDQLNVTKLAEIYLEEPNAVVNEEQISYLDATVFVPKGSTDILPYVHFPKDQVARGNFAPALLDIQDEKNDVIEVVLGTAGRPALIQGLRLNKLDHAFFSAQSLPTHKIIKALRRYNRLRSNLNYATQELSYTSKIQCHVDRPVLFHLKAIIQDGSSDNILFSDGFVLNIEKMMDYAEDCGYAVDIIRKNANVHTLSKSVLSVNKVHHDPRYSLIYELLEKVISLLPQKSLEDATNDERELIKQRSSDIANHCFDIVEKVLHEYLRQNTLSSALLQAFRAQNNAQNGSILLGIAKKLGLKDFDKHKRLLTNLDGTKIDPQLLGDVGTIYVCLPLALAQANEAPQSPMRRLISMHANILEFIANLSNASAARRHNSNAALNAPDLDVFTVVNTTKNFAQTLLPDLNISSVNGAKQDGSATSSARLNALISLSDAFCYNSFNELPTGIKEDWIRISPDKTVHQLPDFNEYTQILYRIMQTTLSSENRKLRQKNVKDVNEAFEVIKDLYGLELPKSLSSVRENFYKNALYRGKSSLGAEALVFAANQPSELISDLLKADFIGVIDKLCTLRSHGYNSAALTQSEESMAKIRTQVITITKLIVD